MITKEKLLAIGSEKLADILLSLYGTNEDIQKQLDIILVELPEDLQKIVSRIRKEISTLRNSTEFIDYYESDGFADELDELRQNIGTHLLEKSPSHAFDLMLEFLNLQDSVFERVDDSNGAVGDVLIEACRDLAKICKQVNKPTEEVVDLVFTRFINDQYGIYDDLITDFKEVLKEEGLHKLQARFEKALHSANGFTIIRGLKIIADCLKDVDAYIRACSITGKTSERDQLSIAKRLIEHGRMEEALTWLDSVDAATAWNGQDERRQLKIQALEVKGDYEKAQTERLDWFEDNLNPELYGQILKHANPELKETFKKQAIEKAFQFHDPHVGLTFLMQTKEFEEGVKFVHLKIDQLHGDQYYTLRPAANQLCTIDPLAATLLYRKLIEPILAGTKSKYYDYAASDLVRCGVLNPKIANWESYQNHELYLKDLEEKHKRKINFWREYKSALQSQAAKQTTQKEK